MISFFSWQEFTPGLSVFKQFYNLDIDITRYTKH
jgi:hypothetical protein